MPKFPGVSLKLGLKNPSAAVRQVQEKLNAVGCGPVLVDGDYGPETKEAVELFQARATDGGGRPLSVDGTVGPLTWGALFGEASLPVAAAAPTALLAKVVETAGAEEGVMEEPPGSNRGPRVDQYIRAAGLNPASASFAWCACFVYWSFRESSRAMGVDNPMIKTAGVMDLWNKAGAAGVERLSAQQAQGEPKRIVPGLVFIMSFGGGKGHTGLVEKYEGGVLHTIEGNTNVAGGREGVGVLRRRRPLSQVNTGFLRFA